MKMLFCILVKLDGEGETQFVFPSSVDTVNIGRIYSLTLMSFFAEKMILTGDR